MRDVFISSRFHESDELRSLRAELTAELVKRSGVRPVNLDDGRADQRAPAERSLDAIAVADLVVLLLGSTYAPLDAEGPSVTELEFEMAMREEVPVLAYRAVGTGEEERAERFRRRVEAVVTIGALSGDAARDAARIVADVCERIPAPRDQAGGNSIVIGDGAAVSRSVIGGGDVSVGSCRG